MTTWYVGAGKCTNNLTQDLYEGSANTQMWRECLSMDEDSLMVMSRLHGNPFFDVCDVGLQPSPACMREQVNVYQAAFVSGDVTRQYQDLFARMGKVWQKGEGLHIIASDDPLLVEKGEAFVHQQFTDYLFDAMLAPEAEQPLWVGIIRNYLDTQFMQQLGYGNVPAGVVLEPVRQRLGLPCEWHGAPIDD